MNTPPPAVTTSPSPITPPPLPSCGYGPTMPARSSISERVAGAGSSVASYPWPFLVIQSIQNQISFLSIKFKQQKINQQVNLKKSTDPEGVFFCSGSLISEKFVLLAAQCLATYYNIFQIIFISYFVTFDSFISYFSRMSMISISGVTLQIGQSNEKGPLVAQMKRKISQFVIHNGYNPSNYVNLP